MTVSRVLLEAALAYAAVGWPIFPCKLDKKPYTLHGFKDASTEPMQIEAWWNQWPNASIGLATGQVSGIVVLDYDPRHGGDRSLADLFQQEIPQTRMCYTGGGGGHLYFRAEGRLKNSAGKLAPGLDIRAEGGYVILPPSPHPSGTPYRWLDPDDPILEFPAFLDALLKRPAPQIPVGIHADSPIPNGSVHYTMVKWAGVMHSRGISKGGIISALLHENATRCDPTRTESDIKKIVESVTSLYEQGATPTEETPTSLDLVLTPYSEIDPRHVSWLWYPYIPLGRLTTIEGNPGDGKSWFSLILASMLSRGHWWGEVAGGESYHEAAATLYLSCEDNPHDTIRPRLDVVEADTSKVIHITARQKETNGKQEFVLITLADLPALKAAIETSGAKLLMIDPVQAFLPKGTDMNKAEQVRPVLAALSMLAEETNCAIVLVRHFGKSVRETTLHKAIGSIDFAAAVRSILIVSRDTREELPVGVSRHSIVQVKNNVAPKGPSMAFELRLNECRWLASTTFTEDDLLQQTGKDKESATAREEAKTYLAALLEKGPMSTVEIKSIVVEAGFSWRTIERAKESLGITAYQEDRKWWWKR